MHYAQVPASLKAVFDVCCLVTYDALDGSISESGSDGPS